MTSIETGAEGENCCGAANDCACTGAAATEKPAAAISKRRRLKKFGI
jgi:hypothetical protein